MDEQKIEEVKVDEKEKIEEKKQKAFEFLKKTNVWVVIFLIIALILGIYIRSLPMMDHTKGIPTFTEFIFSPFQVYSGTPGLWDVTTKSWALGPDLDPWLFLRSAREITTNGALPKIDKMRNVPLGFDNSIETQLLPYMIFWTYKFFHVFNSNATIDF